MEFEQLQDVGSGLLKAVVIWWEKAVQFGLSYVMISGFGNHDI